jgi:polyphosphate kinase
MPRNLDRRVEALVPVERKALQERLHEILDVSLADTELASELDVEGNWRKLASAPHEPVETHVRLQALAIARSKRGLALAP